MDVNLIYQENCLDTMARMPDNFIDCLVTSPPYYGLRSYGTEPQIWGGNQNCDHIWGDALPYAKQDNRTLEEKIAQGANVGSNQKFNNENTTATSGQFCQCGAWLGELGLEPTFQLYISHLLDVFREVRRVLKPTGTVWVNLGDSYNGSKVGNTEIYKHPNLANDTNHRKELQSSLRVKSLMNIPHRFAIAMTDELQFIQRNDIIWHKPACMPASAKDRFTVDFENIFFFTKEPKYYFEQQFELATTLNGYKYEQGTYKEQLESAKQQGVGFDGPTRTHIGQTRINGKAPTYAPSTETGRNMRTTWTVNFEPSGNEHYASYPTKLVEIPIRAGSPVGGLVYDCFGGTATTAVVAHKLKRRWICSELQPKYAKIANERLEPYLAQGDLFV
jgi:site-specific DNA-methyltransferase (adenine-specific)